MRSPWNRQESGVELDWRKEGYWAWLACDHRYRVGIWPLPIGWRYRGQIWTSQGWPIEVIWTPDPQEARQAVEAEWRSRNGG